MWIVSYACCSSKSPGGETDLLSSQERLQSFFDTLVPLLLQCWVEVAPDLHDMALSGDIHHVQLCLHHLRHFIFSCFTDLPAQYFCFWRENIFPRHFLQYDCICHLLDVFSKLKYDCKLILRYLEIIHGPHQAYYVFVHLFGPSRTVLHQWLILSLTADAIHAGIWTAVLCKNTIC